MGHGGPLPLDCVPIDVDLLEAQAQLQGTLQAEGGGSDSGRGEGRKARERVRHIDRGDSGYFTDALPWLIASLSPPLFYLSFVSLCVVCGLASVWSRKKVSGSPSSSAARAKARASSLD